MHLPKRMYWELTQSDNVGREALQEVSGDQGSALVNGSLPVTEGWSLPTNILCLCCSFSFPLLCVMPSAIIL